MQGRPTVRIRDPIHGTQKVTKSELRVVDHRAVQRLRSIKQLGLADLAYPGATHTRYAHALGVMHLAGRVFDTATIDHVLDPPDRERLRTTLRLAALTHDLGHAPLSHSTEQMMPMVHELGLGDWCALPLLHGQPRRATHEDYTLAIILKSSFTDTLASTMKDVGVLPEDVAALLTDAPPPHCLDRFVIKGRDWRPFLRQCVSSELDVDRMDYLLRDSYFAGVPYGRFDLEWLLENLRLSEQSSGLGGGPNSMHLGILARASFGFEDFLLSRFHMFLAVYLHHVPVGYELMLKELNEEAEFALPSDIEEYLHTDDLEFFVRLRSSSNPWAERIVQRRAYRLLLEHQQHESRSGGVSIPSVVEAIQQVGLPVLVHVVRGRLSKYFTPSAAAEAMEEQPSLHLPGLAPGNHEAKSPTIYVVGDGRDTPLESHVALYRRYRDEVSLERVYVAPEHADEAKQLLSRFEPSRTG